MTKTLQSNREIRLFDSFSLVIPPKLSYHTDGIEPVLMKLLEGIAVCKTKGGGSD